MKKYSYLITIAILTISTVQANTDLLVLRLTSTQNGYYDETAIRYIPGATEYFDGSWDAYKIFSPSIDVPSIYTKDANGYKLAINSFSELNADDKLQLFSKINTAGNYVLSVENMNLTPGVTAFVEDILSGDTYQLDASSSITFNLSVGIDISRFTIMFSTPLVISTVEPTCNGSSNGVITINDFGNENFDYIMYDENMNIVAQNSNVNETDVISNIPAANYTIFETTTYNYTETVSAPLTEPAPVIADFSVPATTYLSQNGEVIISNYSSNATTYQWQFGDGSVSTQVEPVHNYTLEGTYQIQLIASKGSCSSTKIQSVEVINDLTTAIDETSSKNLFKAYVYNNLLNVTASVSSDNSTSILLYNITGKVVYSKELGTVTKVNSQIGTDDMPSGMYIVSINNGNTVQSGKVIIIK